MEGTAESQVGAAGDQGGEGPGDQGELGDGQQAVQQGAHHHHMPHGPGMQNM